MKILNNRQLHGCSFYSPQIHSFTQCVEHIVVCGEFPTATKYTINHKCYYTSKVIICQNINSVRSFVCLCEQYGRRLNSWVSRTFDGCLRGPALGPAVWTTQAFWIYLTAINRLVKTILSSYTNSELIIAARINRKSIPMFGYNQMFVFR